MPIYEYKFTDYKGNEHVIERMRPAENRDDPITVTYEYEQYEAHRVISLTANMGYTWSDDVRNSDLPPVNARPEDIKKR
jgi:hypothetical protein